MRFAVIGGDMRIAHLAALLAEDGHEVSTFALEKAVTADKIHRKSSAAEAAKAADCVILPLPVSAQRGLLNAPLSAGEYTLEKIINSIEPGTLVCGGRIDEQTRTMADVQRLALCDYFEREELAVSNAVATAEGAIGIIMQETSITIWGSRILVIGFGRVGKLLAHRLSALGAQVSVSARSCGDKAWIRAYGYSPLDTNALEGDLPGFDVVVNTVPATVLGAARLARLRPGVLCLDLASKPGGMDFAAAAELGVHAVWALSLPGEVAPESSGAIIKDSIINILKEDANG